MQADKKVLLVGGGLAELPLLNVLKKKGCYVITTGYETSGICHKYSDEYDMADYSDYELIYSIAQNHNVDSIVSGCNDYAYLSTAYACEKLGIGGHDSLENALIIHKKNLFRRLLKKLGIKTPVFFECCDMDDLLEACGELGFPLIIKAVDLTGGKGIKKVYNINEAIVAYNHALEISTDKTVVCEQFIEGGRHAISSIVKNGKIVCYMIDDEQYGVNDYLVLGACTSTTVSNETSQSLVNDINMICSHLQLADGLFHCQFIVDKDEIPYMIDPCRRAPGDLYTLFSKYVTGVDYAEEIVKSELGMELADQYTTENNYIARECIMTNRNGTIKELRIEGELKEYIVEEYYNDYKGAYVDDYLKYKAGILLLRFPTGRIMKSVIDRFDALCQIVFED